MKKLLVLAVALCLTGCSGYSQVDNQMTGQVKKVHHLNPIICPNFSTVDVSLGVMKNGVGSMSNHDITLTIWNNADLQVLEEAAKAGSIVDIKYSVWRIAYCREEEVIQYVKVVQ